MRDRCDITSLADDPSLPEMDSINVDLVLPTAADHLIQEKHGCPYDKNHTRTHEIFQRKCQS